MTSIFTEAEYLKEKREEAKQYLGDKYLLHPNNQIKRH